jgi:hypothetical protein
MAWTYYCTEEDVTLRGDTHDDLVDELMRHLRDNHDEDVSRRGGSHGGPQRPTGSGIAGAQPAG